MQALIFNSGIGSRMGNLTKDKPKCLIEIARGLTILDNQIRCLIACGIRSFVITTGKYDEMIRTEISNKCYGADFAFVNNPLYDKTNYIYSMYLAREYFNTDIIMLHGDMVFSEGLLRSFICCNDKNAVILSKSGILSEKDFNATVRDGNITKIQVGDKNADHFLLPVYKLSKKTLGLWAREVEFFISEGKTNVYAEEAFNNISSDMKLKPFFVDLTTELCMEVDDLKDLELCRGRF